MMFTKNMTWISIGAIVFLSFVLYFAYFFFADIFTTFQIYRVVFSLLKSPHFYLLLVLVFFLSVIIDFLYIVIIREVDTPLYLLYKALLERKALSPEERKETFEKIVSYLKSKTNRP